MSSSSFSSASLFKKKSLTYSLCILQAFLLVLLPTLQIFANDATGNEVDSLNQLADELTQIQTRKDVPAEAAADQGEVEKVLQEFENAGENDYPKNTPDYFGVTGQTLEVFSYPKIFGRWVSTGSRTYNLSEWNIDLPKVVPPRFERDVKAETNSKGQLELVARKTKGNVSRIIARQIFENIKPIAIARDQEILTILDKDGQLYAIDMGYAYSNIFRGPLPVTSLVHSGLSNAVLQSGVNVKFYTRGTKPWSPAPEGVTPIVPDQDSQAGDLLLTDNQNRLLGIFNRDIIRTQIYTNEYLLALAAVSTSPDVESQRIYAQVIENSADPKMAADLNQKMIGDSPEIRSALSALPTKLIESLLTRAARNRKASAEIRDEFKSDEAIQSFNQLIVTAKAKLANPDIHLRPQERANLADGVFKEDLTKEWKNLTLAPDNSELARKPLRQKLAFWKYLDRRAVSLVASVTVASAGAYVLDRSIGGHATAWGIHMVSSLLKYWPRPLTSASYSWTLLKSSLALGSFIGLVYGLGVLQSNLFSNARGAKWNFKKSLAATSFRFYGTITLPFYHWIAYLTREPNFFRAMQNGISPLQIVSKNSAVGQKLNLPSWNMPGLNIPFIAKPSTIDRKSKVLQEVVLEQRRVRSLAWTLALLAVSTQEDVDPATLQMFAANQDMLKKPRALLDLIKDEKIKSLLSKTSTEIYFFLKRTAKNRAIDEDIKAINPQEFADYVIYAKNTVALIKNRSGFGELKAKLKYAFLKGAPKTRSFVADLGIPEFEFLMSAEPDEYGTDQFWRQFWIDFGAGIVQQGLIGPRADLTRPDLLAADEKQGMAGLWTTPPHRAEMVDQVRIYALDLPARNGLTMQKNKEVADDLYSPVETITQVGNEKPQSLWDSVKLWTKGAKSLKQVDYGGYMFKCLKRRFSTIQSAVVMILTARIFVAHQPVLEAIPAFLYYLAWVDISFGWQWAIPMKANKLYSENLEERQAYILAARTKMSQGIKLNDMEMVKSGLTDFTELYKKYDHQLPEDIQQNLDQNLGLNEVLASDSLFATTSTIAQSERSRARLSAVLNAGDSARISEARTQLLKEYSANGGAPADLYKLNALSLLSYSLKNPPVATKPNRFINELTTLGPAISTTYFGGFLSAATYMHGQNWGRILAISLPISVVFYAAIWAAQKAVNVEGGVVKKTGKTMKTMAVRSLDTGQIIGFYAQACISKLRRIGSEKAND